MATIKSGLDAGIKAYVPQAREDGGDRYLHGPRTYRGISNPSDHLWQIDELPSSITAASSTANVE
jgi:hypothetical protein